MMSGIKSGYATTIREARDLREQYKNLKNGHRDNIYRVMGAGLGICLAVEKLSSEQQVKFLEKVGFSSSTDAMFAVVAFCMRARTRAARKLASKRSRVLRFLSEEYGVLPEDVPDQIRRLGGIEKLAHLAASNDKPGILKSHEGNSTAKIVLSEVVKKKLHALEDGVRLKLVGEKIVTERKDEYRISKVVRIREGKLSPAPVVEEESDW